MRDQRQQLNLTFAGIPNNQTQPQSPVIKVLYPFNQTIRLDSNATLQALPFNETMPNDIMLQLAVCVECDIYRQSPYTTIYSN